MVEGPIIVKSVSVKRGNDADLFLIAPKHNLAYNINQRGGKNDYWDYRKHCFREK